MVRMVRREIERMAAQGVPIDEIVTILLDAGYTVWSIEVALKNLLSNRVMGKGDVVRFKNAEEGEVLMVIEEVRGDRVLVRHLVDNMIWQPTSVYPLADLELV